jgi:hypothetical protein
MILTHKIMLIVKIFSAHYSLSFLTKVLENLADKFIKI